jgi:hypothetical protein
MPSSSKKQHNFMEAIAHNPGFAKKVGVPQSVGKDFSNADKGKSFSKGGDMATKMDPKMMAMMAAKARGGARPPMGARPPPSMGARPPMGGMGARPPMAPPGGMAPPGMKKGGMTKMASGGFVRSADGIAKQGKTKAKQIKMKSGGMAC